MSTPTAQVSSWLADFGAAVSRGDSVEATSMFGADVVLARPGVVHLEPQDSRRPAAIRAMLEGDDAATPSQSNFRIQGEGERGQTASSKAGSPSRPPSAAAAATASERRQGVDAADHDDGAEGLRGEEGRATAPRASSTARPRIARAGSRHGGTKSARSASPSSPMWSSIGGGQGGIALGARLKRLGVPTIIIEKNARPATPGAIATRACACTTRSGTTTCRTCRSRTIGRCSRPRTRSATGWRCTPR